MKTDRVQQAALCLLLCCGCSAQAIANPAGLGEVNFDLAEMDFGTRVEALLGNANHYRVAVQDGPSVIAYNYIVAKKQDRAIRVSLGRLDMSRYRYEFKTGPDHALIGASISFVTGQDLRAQIIDEIDRHRQQSRVAIGSLPGYPAVYRWESKDRVIQFAFATAEKDNVYSISIIGKKFDCQNFPLEKVFVGEDVCLRKYPRN